MKKGVPVSPGIAVARAYCVDEVLARREPQYLDESALAAEVARFEQTCASDRFAVNRRPQTTQTRCMGAVAHVSPWRDGSLDRRRRSNNSDVVCRSVRDSSRSGSHSDGVSH